MAFEIRVPRLGWTMEEGIFRGWLKENGARVKSGDPIFVLEGEKAAQEIEATDDGVLQIGPASPADGGCVLVGDLIGYLLAEGEHVEFEGAPTQPDDHRDSVSSIAAPAQPVSASPPCASQMDLDTHLVDVPGAGLTISPRAARTAAALGLDWTKIRGTGRTGRIRERDVMAAAAGQKSAGDA